MFQYSPCKHPLQQRDKTHRPGTVYNLPRSCIRSCRSKTLSDTVWAVWMPQHSSRLTGTHVPSNLCCHIPHSSTLPHMGLRLPIIQADRSSGPADKRWAHSNLPDSKRQQDMCRHRGLGLWPVHSDSHWFDTLPFAHRMSRQRHLQHHRCTTSPQRMHRLAGSSPHRRSTCRLDSAGTGRCWPVQCCC